MTKTSQGSFFEDYRVGQVIHHAVPRTIGLGERALYHGLYPARHALTSSDTFAARCGLRSAPLDELIVFHTVFGKSVPDISLNAVANLGYAEGRFRAPVYPGETLTATSEVIGLKQTSSGNTGIVWVRTSGFTSDGTRVLDYVRWVMVRKRDKAAPAPDPVIPELAQSIAPQDLVLPDGLDFSSYDTGLAGAPHRWGDYRIGEHIDHVDGVTLTEAEHMIATRLWQNTAKVHFDVTARPDGTRLIYGGHIISMARTLSFNGLANAQPLLAINGGSHANPCFAGDTVFAGTTVLDTARLSPTAGALRLRLIAAKEPVTTGEITSADGKYLPHVVLDLDIWVAVPI